MPLHTFPLCTLKYVGDIYPGATFKYDTRENIAKDKCKLFYKNANKEIEKMDSKLLYSNISIVDKNKIINIELNTDDELYKSIEIKLDKTNKIINRPIEKELQSKNKEIIKNRFLDLNSIDIGVDILKNKDLVATNSIELVKGYEKQLDKKTEDNLHYFNENINLNNVNVLKDINIESNIEINRVFEKGIDVNSNLNIDKVVRQQTLNKTEYIYVDRNKEKRLDITKDKYVSENTIIDINIENDIIILDRYSNKKLNELSDKYLDKEIKKDIFKNINTLLMYKTNNLSLDKHNSTSLERENVKDIASVANGKLFDIDVLRILSKINSNLELDKIITKDIFINSKRHLDRITDIYMYKQDSVSLKNRSYIDIYNHVDVYGLNKFDTSVYNSYILKGLNKFNVDIYSSYTTTDLEVIKRWWVLSATEPTDYKILPIDYSYLNKPLWINRRDREYGKYLKELKEHPISFMPYIESNKGIDLSYGLKEISISIEIMLDMVNIVAMIIHHSGSQFANASGQESIEFIMEVLLDWLNLDTTIKEMNLKGSREHYVRVYRWIRWEAEKVWFMADLDHSQDKMNGIKYVGILLSNLIDYMKYHHFDLMPLWKNLKVMDIEREFNRIVTNGDIIKDLNKLKGKRHYNMETQNFEKNFRR